MLPQREASCNCLFVTGMFGKACLWGLKALGPASIHNCPLQHPLSSPSSSPKMQIHPRSQPETQRHSGDLKSFYLLFVSCKGVGGEVG